MSLDTSSLDVLRPPWSGATINHNHWVPRQSVIGFGAAPYGAGTPATARSGGLRIL